MRAPHPPTGRKIILELVKEMEDRLYPLLYRVLPPSVYHVYLHPDDYREVEAVTSVIVLDAQLGLSSRVDKLNRQSRLATLIKGKQPPIEVPPGGWEIHLHAEANGDIAPGELGIVSRLSVPPAPRFEGGTPTTRIVRTVVTGTLRRTTTSEETVAAGPAGSADTVPAPAIPGTAANAPSTAGTAVDARAIARLAYVDDQGPHVFLMRKDLISIGRGGSAHWVDVQVITGPRVSREHCRIRRATDGRFFLQDVSTWGSSIDGTRVPPYVRESGGRMEETGEERELPREARIQLADALLIDFHAEAVR
jgi:pSer/pThr/pTyr-binding forkhead associated (FHA) protein